MTDEEIFVKYVKEQSKLIQKYELKGFGGEGSL